MRRVCLLVALLLGLAVPTSAQSPANCVVVNGVSQCANGIVFLTGASFATRAPDGSASAPAYSFVSETNTGWFRNGAGALSATVGGTEQIRISASALDTLAAIRTASNFQFNSGLGSAGDVILQRDAANTLAMKNGTAVQKLRLYQTTTGPVANTLDMTAPTISSGFGTGATPIAGSTAFSMRIDVGTGGVATSGVVGMPTMPTGWNCTVQDMNTNIATRQSASTTASVTFTAASAWTASDKLIATCVGY